MSFLEKAFTWFKSNNRKVEKISLLAGSLLSLAVGLVYNIFADISLNTSVGFVIYGLLTGIAGGALILWGLYMNLFDVTYKGLAIIAGGILLNILNIFMYPAYLQSEAFILKTVDVQTSVKPLFIVFIIFSILSVVLSLAGFALQIYQRIIEFKDVKKLIVCGVSYASCLAIVVAIFIQFCATEVSVFKLHGVIEHSWISFLFIPIPIAALIIAYLNRNEKVYFKANAITSGICCLVLLLSGLTKAMSVNTKYDDSSIDAIREKIQVELPETLDVISIKHKTYEIIYAKADENYSINNSAKKWQNTSDSKYDLYIPESVSQAIEDYDLFYFDYEIDEVPVVEDTHLINKLPTLAGKYKATYIAYNKETHGFIIVKDLEIEIKKATAA